MTVWKIPFNRIRRAPGDIQYLQDVLESDHLSGNGPFSKRCQRWLERRIGSARALLTTSGTAALEMAVILCGVGPGDEVILPSFTFPSTANAVVLRGAVPVFVDIKPTTLCLNPDLVKAAITTRTKAVIAVHYAGMACDIAELESICRENDLYLIEDAAQAILSKNGTRNAGQFGDFAAISFHETKNISCGEGGALLINRKDLVDRAEIIWEKGTDRGKFYRGEIDKYQWVDLGSSYLPNELSAALLWSQLEIADTLLDMRLEQWRRYDELLAGACLDGKLQRPMVPDDVVHNGHTYYVLLPDNHLRESLRKFLTASGIEAVFHYLPLHDSPAGKRYGIVPFPLKFTSEISERLLRLPLWEDMDDEADQVVRAILRWEKNVSGTALSVPRAVDAPTEKRLRN